MIKKRFISKGYNTKSKFLSSSTGWIVGIYFFERGHHKTLISEALLFNRFFSEGVRKPQLWEGGGWGKY